MSLSKGGGMNPLDKLEQELKYINKTEFGRRAFLGALPVLLASCATSRHRQREGDNTGQATSLSVEDEKKMTQEYIPKMRKDYPPLKSDKIQHYIASLGRKIASKNGLEGKPYNYNFSVVDTKMINAFALPAGTIYVTAPLIEMAETESELAGVIGHEIGHVKARHTAERIDKAKKEQKKSLLYGLGGALLGGLAGYGLGKLVCSPQNRECLRRMTKYGSMAGAGGALLIQKYAFMANSREDEMEADRIGFRTSVGAGYHSDHVGRFYKKLLEMEKKYNRNKNSILTSFADAMSTHPPSEERVQQMDKMSRKWPSPKRAVVSTKEFEEIKKTIKKLKG